MKDIIKDKKKIYGIVILIILISIVFICFFKLNFSLIYSDNTRLDIYIGKDYDTKDIKTITKEIFKKQKVQYQKIETFNDTVAVTVKEATDDQINELKEKLKEKYELETTENLIQVSKVAHLRGRDIVKPYIIPTALATIIILVYIGIRYMKLGILKVVCDLSIKLIVLEALYLSAIAIFRLPIGIYTMPIAMAIYLLVIIILVTSYQNKLNKKQLENKNK